jgi:Fe-S-cluster containining protein
MIADAAALAPFLEKLKTLYEDMDRAYEETADSYGFRCRGCEDNCCLTRFYHHTWLEYACLRQGYLAINERSRSEIFKKAGEVCEQSAEADAKREPIRIMCPLNAGGLCGGYAFRPMICRLHGLPHELRRPGQAMAYGPGCGDFEKQTLGQKYIPFDRTPFYARMARLENEMRTALGISPKIRMTIAGMIRTFPQ